jgi:hypothetical protein
MRYTCANLLYGISCCSEKLTYVQNTSNITFAVAVAFTTDIIANITPQLWDLII